MSFRPWMRANRGHLIVLVSQVLASGGNFLALVLASRSGSGADFGAASLAFTAYALGGTLIRPFTGHVVQISLGRASRTEHSSRLHPLALGGVALAAGCAISALVAIAFGSRVPAELRPAWLLLVGAIPVLLVYDLTRYWLTTLRRPGLVTLIDGGWLLLMAAGYVAVRPSTAVDTLAVWAATGLLAAAGGVITVLMLSPIDGADLRWTLAQVWRLGGPMVAETGLLVATNWSIVLVAPFVVGLAELGQLQAFDLVFGPVTMLTTALSLAVQPKVAALVDTLEPERAWAAGLAAGNLLLAVASLTYALFLLSPGNIVPELFGLENAGWLLATAAFSRALAQAPQLSATILTRATRRFRAAIQSRVLACVVGAGGGITVMVATSSVALGYIVAYSSLAAGSAHVLLGLRRAMTDDATRARIRSASKGPS